MTSSYQYIKQRCRSVSFRRTAAINSPVPGEFPTQRPVTRGFDVFFDLGLNKRLSKQSWGCWFETQSRSLWRHCNKMDLKSSSDRSPCTAAVVRLDTAGISECITMVDSPHKGPVMQNVSHIMTLSHDICLSSSRDSKCAGRGAILCTAGRSRL